MTDYNCLDYTVDAGVLVLTLTRPQQMNAFTVEMANELVDAFNRASDDDAVGAVVVTGSGKAFCAGMDLTRSGNVFGLNEALAPTRTDMDTRRDDPAVFDGVRDTGGRVTLAIFDCKKPVIAAINGAAVGIGATMTLAMDIRLASTKARIGFVFGRLGIVNEACSSWFLPRIVGISQALEWVYSAEILTPDQARDGGLIKTIHAPEDLLTQACRLAHKFVDNRSPVATALMRQMLYRNSGQPHPLAAHKIDSLAMFHTSRKDGKEGVEAFLDKRTPEFTQHASTDMPPFYEAWLKATEGEQP